MSANGRIFGGLSALFLAFVISTAAPSPAAAHCDGMDGPVVKAAQKALATGDVNLVLIWVRPDDEGAIREAFDRTRKVRRLSPEAKDLADLYFFETLVRTHRAGEGAPYTGLKPAGRDLGPAIPAADRSLVDGDIAPLAELLVGTLRAGLAERYRQAMEAKSFPAKNVAAGREYVERYVTFIHYVEAMFATAAGPVHGHFEEEAGAPRAEE